MRAALAEAELALRSDDVPVGAVVLDRSGTIIAAAHNRREDLGDPTAHAEVLALRAAAASARGSGGWRLEGCTLVVTLEPCVMCAGALIAARVDRLVFGAWDLKAGACGSVWDMVRDSANLTTIEVIPGVLADEAAAQLARFFAPRRR
jgi:tRNA(adenine34) deaminase